METLITKNPVIKKIIQLSNLISEKTKSDRYWYTLPGKTTQNFKFKNLKFM